MKNLKSPMETPMFKVMKILFFTIFFFGLQPVNGGETVKTISCGYYHGHDNKDKGGIKYRFDSTHLDQKANALKNDIKASERVHALMIWEAIKEPNMYLDPITLKALILKIRAADQRTRLEEQLRNSGRYNPQSGLPHNSSLTEAYHLEKDRSSRCEFNEETITHRLTAAMNKKCHFKHTSKICAGVYDRVLEKACGKVDKNPGGKGCSAGVIKKSENWLNSNLVNQTPEVIEKFKKYRNNLYNKAMDFKDGGGPQPLRNSSGAGYKQCAQGIKNAIESRCFEVYNLVFDQELKKLAGRLCTVEAVDLYIGEFKDFIRRYYLVLFEGIKNDHVQARLCTLKIVDIVQQLDNKLKQATQQDVDQGMDSIPRQTASSQQDL